MLVARVRQLFAQYPLLVVGYSLNDPDFHLVYRQMVRAMSERHPLGLAVVPWSESAESAASAARRYWESLGLRIVRIRSSSESGDSEPALPAVLAEQFRRFFDLTAPISHASAVDRGFHFAQQSNQTPQVFKENLLALVSAFSDKDLERVWRHPGDRYGRWLATLKNSLTEESKGTARERAREFNLAAFPGVPPNDGSTRSKIDTLDSRKPDTKPPHLFSIAAEMHDERLSGVLDVLSRDCGHDLIWEIEALLDCHVPSIQIANWLRLALEWTEVLDYSLMVQQAAFTALLILGGMSDADITEVQKLARVRFPELAKALGSTKTQHEDKRKVVVTLKDARLEVRNGNRDRARQLYREALDICTTCNDIDAPLLVFLPPKGLVTLLLTDSPRKSAQMLHEH